MFGAHQSRATGIHIADQTLHIAELVRHRGEVSIHNLVQEALPFACTPVQLAGEERGELAQFVRRVGADRRLSFRNPCLALGAHAFLLKRRPWIQGSEEVNQDHLRWEVQQVLPDRLAAYALDIVKTAQGYFLVAARRRALKLYGALCRKAGLKKPLYDIAPFALYNALEASGILAGEEMEMLVDISPPEALVLLLNGGQLQAVGSCAWPGESQEAQRESLAESMQQMIEAESSLRRPKRLWLSGAAAADPEWQAVLRERLAMEMAVFDPLSGVDDSPLAEVASPAARAAGAVAVGLAYRRLTEGD